MQLRSHSNLPSNSKETFVLRTLPQYTMSTNFSMSRTCQSCNPIIRHFFKLPDFQRGCIFFSVTPGGKCFTFISYELILMTFMRPEVTRSEGNLKIQNLTDCFVDKVVIFFIYVCVVHACDVHLPIHYRCTGRRE